MMRHELHCITQKCEGLWATHTYDWYSYNYNDKKAH